MQVFTPLGRALTALLVLLSFAVRAQTPYALSSGTYTENFDQISGWANGFASGTGAAPFSAATPSPTLPNQNTVFSTLTGGGVQKGTNAIVLLATGATDNSSAAAFDLNLDFTGTTAGSVSLDWASVANSTGSRQATFKLQTNTGTSGAWVDLPGSSVVLTNNVATTGSLTALALPAAFNGNAAAKIRFYIQNTAGGTNPSGSRPKVSLDNLRVTATTGGPVAPTITTGTISGSPFCTATAGAAVAVPFTSTGGLTGDFAAQLSDAAGVFPADLAQNLIGTGTATPIAATIPAGTPAGTGYRIRVVHAASATSGSPNGANLTVTVPPATNSVTVGPAADQTFVTTGTGTPLTASALASSAVAWYYGTNAAGPFSTPINGATAATYTPKGADFGGAAGTYYLVARATSTCGSVAGTSTPVTITLTVPQPTVTASPNPVPDFGSIVTGAASAGKSVSLTGSSLGGDVTLTPPAGFQVRTGAAAFSCAPLTLPVAGGSLSATVEVRFVPALAQAYSGTISVSSPGAGSLPGIRVSGTGTAPTYPASVSTAAATGITATTATAGGEVLEDGGSPVTARGVAYATTEAPTTQDDFTTDGSGPGTFTSPLTGLLPNTTYYLRAYATNAQGTSYGQQVSFTTPGVALAAEPTQASTLTATATTPTSVTLDITGGNGAKKLLLATPGPALSLQPQDGTTYAGNAQFGQGDQPTPGTYVVLAGAAASLTVSGLQPDTEYTFAVFDYNDDATSGAENYLLTPHGELTLSTPALPAGLLLADGFDYPAGDRLTDHGWTAHSAPGTNAILVATPGLSMGGYDASGFSRPAASVANAAAALAASGEDVSRTFPSQAAGTPVYASVLVNVSSAGAADYFLHLSTDPVVSTFRARLFVRAAGTNQVQFGVSGSGTTTQWDPTFYNLSTTYQLLVRYTFGPSGTETRLYVNPGQAEPATAGATSTEAATSAPTSIGAVALRQGSNTSPLLLDGLRVANSYSAARAFVAPLPVTLTRFGAQRQTGGAVRVTWATAQETNARSFQVQRSLDGRTFQPVATQAAAGTTTQARQYQALDAAAPTAQLYYRLEQQDVDGTRHYSSVVSVAPGSAAAASLTVAPNPAGAGQPLTLTVTGRAGQRLTLQVLDNAGRLQHTQALQPATEAAPLPLPLPAGLPAGTYILRVTGAGTPPLHTRLVLTR